MSLLSRRNQQLCMYRTRFHAALSQDHLPGRGRCFYGFVGCREREAKTTKCNVGIFFSFRETQKWKNVLCVFLIASYLLPLASAITSTIYFP